MRTRSASETYNDHTIHVTVLEDDHGNWAVDTIWVEQPDGTELSVPSPCTEAFSDPASAIQAGFRDGRDVVDN